MIEAGATFVARVFAGDIKHLTDLIIQGVEHEGFAFIEVLQPAIPNHKWEEYREYIEYLEKESENYLEAIKVNKEKHKFTIGVFFRTSKPVYHRKLYGEHNPLTKKLSRKIRLEKLHKILELL